MRVPTRVRFVSLSHIVRFCRFLFVRRDPFAHSIPEKGTNSAPLFAVLRLVNVLLELEIRNGDEFMFVLDYHFTHICFQPGFQIFVSPCWNRPIKMLDSEVGNPFTIL